ncbi:MAG: AAA family ATPase, partial [Leadbetterella sp.]|nr:AAA family ATPase [Leadbetterella sp.]
MHISRIRISNFRIFDILDLEINKGLNLLVGENDSGKTALIDAIRITLGTNSNDRIYIKEQDFHDESNDLSIQITFADVDKHAHRFVEHLSHEEFTKEDGSKSLCSVLHIQLKAEKTSAERRGYPYIKSEIKSGVDGNGLSVESEIRDFLSATYLKPLRDAESELSSGRASRLSQILSSSKDIKSGRDTILTIVAKANDALMADNATLKKAAKNIEANYLHELIFEQDKERLGVHIDIAGVTNQVLDGTPESTKHRYLRGILEGLSLALTKDRKLHGLGYQNLLFMGAEMLLLEQEAKNEIPLLLIEEPEAHLHPQLQMKLLQFINLKVATAGVQCFLTTHSPNISAKVSPSNIIMLNKGKAFSLRPEETELQKDDYKYLDKFLDATKANVFFAKSLLFVEGDGENILLPKIARLLGKPLEDYGVSIIKYDNSGSWKRFARLFLRKNKNGDSTAWNPTKVCVLRDLDLWPDCAEEKEDKSNLYGFIKETTGNKNYWLRNKDLDQIRIKHIADLERQNIKVKISDDWTFEYCLAKYGLYKECCQALKVSDQDMPDESKSDDEKATFILSKVSKTDFAYDMADILEKQFYDKIQKAKEKLSPEEQKNLAIVNESVEKASEEYALELKDKLPTYIVEAIEYVTSP